MWATALGWKRRVEEHCLDHGIYYPWYVPVLSFVAQVVAVLLALGQRHALWPLDPLALVIVLVVASGVLQLGLGWWLPWYADAAGGVVAAVLLVSVHHGPVTGGIDSVPALLMFLTTETAARDGVRQGSLMGAISLGFVALAYPWGFVTGMQMLTVLLGYTVGVMLLWQSRALAAEKAAREQAWQQATLAERQRIARDIHDLIAHSLSVTLLHLTGARHALRDLRDSEDPAEARRTADDVDSALADAERVGRQAMADIRRTVSAMAQEPSPVTALPGGDSLRGLIEQFRSAGLDITYDEDGDPSALPAATGLGLYRIAQESLSNVVKHAPAGPAAVRLTVSDRQARLLVRNPMASGHRRGVGSGLAGMRARAEQLGAALEADGQAGSWTVDLRIPLERSGHCPVDRIAASVLGPNAPAGEVTT